MIAESASHEMAGTIVSLHGKILQFVVVTVKAARDFDNELNLNHIRDLPCMQIQ